MKYTRSALTQLTRQYKKVLIKCAMLNAAILIGAVELSKEAKAETLEEAIADATTPSYTMEGNYTGAFGSLAGSDRTFTIYGNNYSISGGNTHTGIEVASGQTLGLENVLWFYGTSGNTINNAGTLNVSYNYDEYLGEVPGYGSVSNSNIMNITNRYTGDSEGLISFTGVKNTGTLNITEDSLRPVNIITITDDATPKGIINIKGGHLETSELTQKTVNLKGGGLYVYGNLNSDVVVDGTLEHTGNLRIEHNNPAINGAISGTFRGNDYQGLHYYSNVNNNLTLNNVNFDNNSYEYDGGALYYEIYNGNGSGNLTLVNNQFTNNHARTGGAILSKTQGVTSITNGIFTGNYSTTYGGAIYQRGGTLSIKDSTFTGNKSGDGAAIYSNYASVIISAQNGNVEFTNNNSTGTASGTGTGISVYEGSLTLNADTGHTLTVNDNIYSSNGMAINANSNTGTVALNGALALGSDGLTLSSGTLKLNSAAANSIAESNLTLNGGIFDIANGAIDNLTFTNAINNAVNSSLVLDASIGDTNTADKITSDISGASTIFISGINFISDNKNGGEVQIADGNIKSKIAVSDVAGGYANVQYNSSTGVLSLANKIDWLQQTNGANSGYRFTKTNNGIMPVSYTSGENNYTFYTDILKKNYTDDNSVAHDLKYAWNNATHTLSVTNSDDSALSTTKSTIVRTGDGSSAAPFVYTGDHVGNTPIGLNRWNTFGTITGDFVGNTDGAIAMGMGVRIPSITGNFIGNTGKSAFIFSGDHSWGSSVTSITGDFIGNYSNYIYNNNGGAIFISNWNNGGIGEISGDFIGNKADGSGGAICLADGYINSITGNFVNNYAVNNGGAIQVGDGMNGANMTVTGDFIANQAGSKGGAVYNAKGASTRLIDSSFIGNIAPEGAAIHNNNKYATLVVTAKNKDIEFTNNNSTGLSGGDGYGIYNIGQLTLNAREGRTFTVNDKVYSEGNISINDYYADWNQNHWERQDGTVIFNNDFTQTGATGISTNDASAGGGTVVFNGTTTLGALDLSGTATLKLGAGAGTSTFGAVTFTRSPILDIANNSAQTLTVASIKNNAKLNIDLDFTGDSVLADAINITTGGQTGVLTIDSINALTNETGAIRSFSDLEILKGTTTNVTLALSETLQQDERFFGDEVESVTREISTYTDNATFGQFADNKFTSIVYAHKTQNKLYLDDTKTKLSFSNVETASEYVKSDTSQDVLQALNQSTSSTRSLTTDDATKTYTVGADLGTTATGQLTVQGVTDGTDTSLIDLNNKGGFVVDSDAAVTLDTVKITGAKTEDGSLINNIAGTVALNNVEVEANANNIISNAANMNLTGTNIIQAGINGTGTANITSGETTLADIEQTTVNVETGATLNADASKVSAALANDGVMNLSGATNTNTITGSGTTSFSTDMNNSGNITQGTITVASGKTMTNSGTITITDTLTADTLVNNSILNLNGSDMDLNTAISGTGMTNINGNVALGSSTTLADTTVSSSGSLDIGTNTVTLGNTTINGTLKMEITDMAKDSNSYTGGHLNVADLNLGSNSKLSMTVAQGLITEKNATTGALNLITASGTQSGQFAEMLSNNRYKVTATDDGKFQIAYTASASDIVDEAVGTQNNKNTGDAWDNAGVSSPLATAVQNVLNDLSQHDAKGYVDALTNLAPTDSMVHVGITQDFNNIIGEQIAARLDTQGLNSGDVFEKRGAWVQTLYNHSKQDSNSKNQGFTGKTAGIAFGMDGQVNDTTTAGFGYAFGTTKADSLGRDTDVDGHTIFAYGKYQPSSWFVRGMVNYGFAKYEEKANVGGIINKSKYDVQNYGTRAYVGYDLPNGFTPEAGLRLTHIDRNNYTDSVGQHVKTDGIDVLTATLGMNYSTTVTTKDYKWSPKAHVTLTYDLASDDANATVNVANSVYDIKGEKLNRFGVEAGVGAEISVGNWNFSAEYDLGARDDYLSHTGMLKVKYNF